jgi:hypothetical protein
MRRNLFQLHLVFMDLCNGTQAKLIRNVDKARYKLSHTPLNSVSFTVHYLVADTAGDIKSVRKKQCTF